MPLGPVKKATGGMTELAQAIAVPHEHKAQRIPSFPNLERTAVVQTVATTTLPVAASTMRDFTLVRSPTYPLWTMAAPSTGAASLFYTATGPKFGSLSSSGATIVIPNDPFTSYNTYGADSAFISAMERRYPLCRTKDGRVFVPCGANNGLTGVQVSLSGSITCTLTLNFEMWDGTGETTFASADVTLSGVASADYTSVNTLSAGGFFRLASISTTAFTAGNQTLTSFSIGILSGGTLYSPSSTGCCCYAPVFAPPEFTASRVPYGSTRANAAAALMSNVTAVLDKEGTVSCARIPRTMAPKCLFGTYSTVSRFTTLISSVYPKDRYFGPMEKGLYAYSLPDAATDGFVDCISDCLYSDGFNAPYFQLEAFEYVSLITFSDLGGSGSTLAITQDAHLEFRSSSMLFPVGYSQTTLEAYHMAQMALAQQGVFFENPVHLAALSTLIRGAVSRLAPIVLPYAKHAAVAVGNKLLSSAVSAINTKMSQAGFSSRPQAAPKRPAQKKKARAAPARRKK